MANENSYNPSYLPGESQPFVSPYAAGLANPETIPRMYGETVEQARARVQAWDDELRQRRATRIAALNNANGQPFSAALEPYPVGANQNVAPPVASTQVTQQPTSTQNSSLFSIGGGSGTGSSVPATAPQQTSLQQQTQTQFPTISQPQSYGKFGPAPQSVGKFGFAQPTYMGGFYGQPRYGQPNQYANTMRGWDNASIMGPSATSGGGKGGSSYGYPVARTNYEYNPTTGGGKGKGGGNSAASQTPTANQNAAPANPPTEA